MQPLPNLFDLTGKTALVTGASSGLGVVFAEALARAGARVVLAARRVDRLQEVARKLEASGAATLVTPCDVTDPAQVEAMAATATERFGRVDIVVNNAGQAADGAAVPERLPHDAFEQTMRVNLLGTWYCCRAFGQRMLADGQGGSIINISSIAGLAGIGDFPVAYQVSKAAVLNLTRNLACSWADRKVRVNAIAPGWFPSEMTDQVLSAPVFLAWTKKMCPMGRLGEVRELVGPLILLASDASSFVTGHTLAVDGGIAATVGGTSIPAEWFETLSRVVPGDLTRHIRAT
jgi:NAD(P)-dependent dehydrogenase (short-subunit alcohol dehydrogenase family)